MSNPRRPVAVPPGSRRRRDIAVACVLAFVTTGAVACTAESDEPEVVQPDAWSYPADASCPQTPPMPADRYPQALREQEGKTTFFGTEGLWVDLSGFDNASQVDDAVRARHRWWTLDASGTASEDEQPPRVRATRLDGDGHESATLVGHSDGDRAWWSTRLDLPAASCWLVTGELDGTVVRAVVKAG